MMQLSTATGMFGRIIQFLASRAASATRVADRRLRPESRFIVMIDEQCIVCRRPSAEEEAVAWDDLEAVIIETNDTGPFGADVWWFLFGRPGSGGCAIPQGATGEESLLKALQALPGFGNHSLMAAMACTDNRRFLCWRRSPAD